MKKTNNLKAIHFVRKKIYGDLSIIGTYFLLTVSISNVVQHFFGFQLLPIVQLTFDAFHNFCHFILQLFVFSWLTKFLEMICYGITYVGSLILPIIPIWPKIIIPHIVADLALLSFAFTRIFQSADYFVPRSERLKAELQMTRNDWNDIKIAEGPFWGPIHRFVESVNTRIWKIINDILSFISYPVRNFPKIITFLHGVLIMLAGTILMWGYIRLIGYTINIIAARKLSSPIMAVRKKFYKYFFLSLAGAIVATLVFIYLNGWVADRYSPPNK